MRKQFKEILVIATMALLIFALVGCGAEKKEDENNKANDTKVTTEKNEKKEEKEDPNRVSIVDKYDGYKLSVKKSDNKDIKVEAFDVDEYGMMVQRIWVTNAKENYRMKLTVHTYDREYFDIQKNEVEGDIETIKDDIAGREAFARIEEGSCFMLIVLKELSKDRIVFVEGDLGMIDIEADCDAEKAFKSEEIQEILNSIEYSDDIEKIKVDGVLSQGKTFGLKEIKAPEGYRVESEAENYDGIGISVYDSKDKNILVMSVSDLLLHEVKSFEDCAEMFAPSKFNKKKFNGMDCYYFKGEWEGVNGEILFFKVEDKFFEMSVLREGEGEKADIEEIVKAVSDNIYLYEYKSELK